ncbi:hypothetical protein FPV67DRAFT_1428067 [Lyophyllum atratum]|nr:hypothetical protein FPV67DRAFT_1428067 [Lyophyllum atratum]
MDIRLLLNPAPGPPPLGLAHSVRENVKLSRQTTLSKLYEYPLNACLEYPETSESKETVIGHLFKLDPSNWKRPSLDFVYSKGAPKGYSKAGAEYTCHVLVDSRTNIPVPCKKKHYTCQGVKICPYVDHTAMKTPHTSATREALRLRLAASRDDVLDGTTSGRDVFERTSAFICALQKLGCTGAPHEATTRSLEEEQERKQRLAHEKYISRGYSGGKATCDGRLIFEYSFQGRPLININTTGCYDINYIEAILNNDLEEASRIEESALGNMERGPLATCSTVTNCSQQKLFCPNVHRDENDQLIQPELEHLRCKCKYTKYEPLEEYRAICPYVLITCRRPHRHPIPLPIKTPQDPRAQILKLLESTKEADLPDLTPRSFMRHPVVKAYLSEALPGIANPTLGDIHTYIDQVKRQCFPHGSGWEGVVHLFNEQNTDLKPEDHYIRRVLDIPLSEADSLDDEEEDEDDDGRDEVCGRLQIIICMSKEGSRRFSEAQYLQSDIGHKRVIGFKEFEVASLDKVKNTSVTLCRVYMNRQSAVAHQRVLQELENILEEDTEKRLKWRHIHGSSLDDYQGMVLQWTGDQHMGQAKGLGLHLQRLAQEFVNKIDLHDETRTLQSLTCFEHLARIFRLCYIHFYRNIRKCPVSEGVRNLMRSLVCITHDAWDDTVDSIKVQGGQKGINWVSDKQRGDGFAFKGICWEKSLIPLKVWQTGDKAEHDSGSNVVESVHADVNREGVRCTLLGGLKKGQYYDTVKLKTLTAMEDTGVKQSYRFGHLSENMLKNLKRKGKSQLDRRRDQRLP